MINNFKLLTYSFELLVIVASITLATFAWFNKNRGIQNDDLLINTDSRIELLISLDEGNTWSTEAQLDLPEDFQFDNEITGNGINFYVPSNKRDDGTPITFIGASASDYLEFDILFKLTGNGGVFLKNDSYISPTAGVSSEDLIGPLVERISSSGDFSRDLIASSLRVAFIENDYISNTYVKRSNTSMVWAPNKNYEVNCDTGVCNVLLDSTNIQPYNYVDASNSANFFESRVENIKDNINSTIDSAHGDPMIAYIDTNVNDGIKRVTVRIWIEGNDRDNLTALTGGMFVMNLSFTAIGKQINITEPDVSVSGSSILGFTEDMEYSTDYGNTWLDDVSAVFNNITVYVRSKENSSMFASSYKVLEF